MDHPLVSVIIPNYCHARYLDERIQSVLGQTYQNFELIILDDCSPDDGASREVIERYRPDPHVSHIVYNEQNSGSTFRQWNKGFNLAKGEYIWIAESDDVAQPDLLQIAINNLQKNDDIVLSFCNSELIDAEGKQLYITKEKPFDESYTMDGKSFVRQWMLARDCIYNASAVVFRKSVLAKIQPSGYDHFRAAGDRMFWALICLEGRVAFDNHPLNKFRQHQVKVSNNALSSGLTVKEDCQIYTALFKKVHPSVLQSMQILEYHLTRIQNSVQSEEKQRELIAMWHNAPHCSLFFWRLYGLRWRVSQFMKHLRSK